MKKLIFWIILIISVYVSVELLLYAGIYSLDTFRQKEVYRPADKLSAIQQKSTENLFVEKQNYVSFDATLGWSIKANGFSKLYQANSSAIRSDREYTITPPEDISRISAFGDSFTHCDEVKNNETWQASMERSDSSVEVLNFGVGGFGLDQAYLRYLKDGAHYQSDFVLIGFMRENIKRNVNIFRPFYRQRGGISFTKPRFQIKDGRLALIHNPMKKLTDYQELLRCPRATLSKLGKNDYFYKKRYSSNKFDWLPTVKLATMFINYCRNKLSDDRIIMHDEYNKKSEAFKVTKKIFDEFYTAATTNKSMPIILIFPNGKDLERYRKKGRKQYWVLLEYFDLAGYRYLDLMDAFNGVDREKLFEGNYHYAPLANTLVANYILNYINDVRKRRNL